MPLDVRNSEFVVLRSVYENESKSVRVVSAKSVKSGALVAIKSLRREAHAALIEAELRALRLLRGCPYVIQLLDVLEDDECVHIVLEWAPSDLMEELAKSSGGLADNRARDLFEQLLTAVEAAHSRGVVHRDLKCENVLIGADGRVRLADFGLAGFFDPHAPDSVFTERCGTRPYAAPEQLSAGLYDGRRTDVWSLGVVLFAMLSGTLPFREASLLCRRYARHVSGQRIAPWTRFSPDILSLLCALLEPVPTRRPFVRDALRHPWVNGRGSCV